MVMMAQDPVTLASQADKAAQSAQSGFSFFSARTDKYESAVELYTSAASAYKLQKNYREAGLLYEKARPPTSSHE